MNENTVNLAAAAELIEKQNRLSNDSLFSIDHGLIRKSRQRQFFVVRMFNRIAKRISEKDEVLTKIDPHGMISLPIKSARETSSLTARQPAPMG